MLKKRKRAKHTLPDGEVNIVSLMDILTTLLFFIIMVASLTKFTAIESTSLVSGSETKDKKNVFTLQVSVRNKKVAQIWLGPLTDLKIMNEGRFKKFLKLGKWKGNPKAGFTKDIVTRNDKQLLSVIQSNLIEIKKGFPHEHSVVVSFGDTVKYQQMINFMEGIKTLGKDQEAFVYTNLVNTKEQTKVLFPQLIIAEEDV